MRMAKFAVGAAALLIIIVIALPFVRDEVAWRTAQGDSRGAGYESYLRSWPAGRHAGEARSALDEANWRTASQSNDRELLEKYLQAFPSGTHASEARTHVENLDWESASKVGRVTAYEKYLVSHAEGQHVEAAKAAIAEGRARVNREDAEKLTQLMRASARGDRGLVTQLLADGADPNVRSREQSVTALMFAAYFGHTEVVNLLLEKGAAVDAKDGGGNGPIDWAAVGGRKDIAKQFADEGPA